MYYSQCQPVSFLRSFSSTKHGFYFYLLFLRIKSVNNFHYVLALRHAVFFITKIMTIALTQSRWALFSFVNSTGIPIRRWSVKYAFKILLQVKEILHLYSVKCNWIVGALRIEMVFYHSKMYRYTVQFIAINDVKCTNSFH